MRLESKNKGMCKGKCVVLIPPASRLTLHNASSLFMSQAVAAKRLGISPRSLARAGDECALYAPIGRGLPGVGAVHGVLRYHVRQIELITDVALGRINIDVALLDWELFKRNSPQRTRRK